MGKNILILDDDVDFNSLLTDIFTQADYDVFSEQNPERALEIFREQEFDLVVTDQKMPNLSGAEFMRKIKSIRADVPVIMVSGYLDNETIRDLIKEGVGGVFLKPLNVFSLLKRTRELIEESEKDRAETAAGRPSGESQRPFVSNLPYAFRSYPCKSEVSMEFAKKLHALRDFKTNLLLVGRRGTAFRAICQDLKGFSSDMVDEFVYLHNDQIGERRIRSLVQEASDKQVERLTLVLLEAQFLEDEQKELIVRLSRKEGDFADLNLALRLIFCLHEDLDSLYERGAIDENLYILMGTSEARAPNLEECAEDIPILAQQFIADAITEKNRSSVPRIDKLGRQWLQEQVWKRNHQELREFMSGVVGRLNEDLITSEHLRAYAEGTLEARGELTNERFMKELSRTRDTYVRAFLILSGGDCKTASRGLALPELLVNRLAAAVE